MKFQIGLSALLTAIVTVGCAGNPTSSTAYRCENGLKQAYKELDRAKASGVRSGIDLTKATSLLIAASTQAEFGKYPNCLEKVNRARAYISHSKNK